MNINKINHDINQEIIDMAIKEMEEIIENNKKYKPISFKNDVDSLINKDIVDDACRSMVLEVINKYDNLGSYSIKISSETYIKQIREMTAMTSKIYNELPQDVANQFGSLVKKNLSDIEKGKITQKQAIKSLKRNYAGATIKYKNGANVPFDKYLEMLYTTNLTRVLETRSNVIAKDLDTDIYEYSSHENPREDCAGLQGNLVTYGRATKVTDLSGKTFNVLSLEAHGYGEPSGALGINCKHYMFPFVVGVSKRVGTHRNIIEETIRYAD